MIGKVAVAKWPEEGQSGLTEAREDTAAVFEATDAGTPLGCWWQDGEKQMDSGHV